MAKRQKTDNNSWNVSNWLKGLEGDASLFCNETLSSESKSSEYQSCTPLIKSPLIYPLQKKYEKELEKESSISLGKPMLDYNPSNFLKQEISCSFQ